MPFPRLIDWIYADDGLFTIIDSCPNLVKLDLTSCRGIRVGDRRRFFEVIDLSWLVRTDMR